MKKTICLLLLLLATALPLRAAHQYSAIRPNQGAGVEINADIAALYLTASTINVGGIAEFGYYLLDGKGNSLNTGAAFDLDALRKNGYASLGAFKAGDRIAFWMKTDDGRYLDSYHRNGKDERYAAYVGNNGKQNLTIAMGDVVSGWGPVSGSANLLFAVTGEKPVTPTGQPLPGTAVTLLVGAVLLGLALRRGRTAAV